jgi:integrase
MKLHQRGSTYHFRLRVPSDLIDVLNRQEIHQSLKTTDGRTARARATAIQATLVSGFDRLRLAKMSAVDDREVKNLASVMLASLGGARKLPSDNKTTEEVTCLEELIQLHLKEKQLSVDGRTHMSMEYSYRLALYHIGNIKLTELNRAVCRSYRDALKQTPCFFLRHDNASEQVNEVLSDKSVNQHLQFLSAMFRWATREELIQGNPAEGLAIKKRKRDWDERFAYDDNQLQRLLGTLWLDEVRDERVWAPLIALFTGMRQEEICQLRRCDLIKRDGIWCFSITADAGHLKSAAAERFVPIHNWLLMKGFPEVLPLETMNEEDRIWSLLSPNRLDRYSNSVCKWFSRYKRKKGFTDTRYCFHSLRHTFINKMKQNEVPEPLIRQLVGHGEGSITLGRYGKDYDIEKLNKYLNDVHYDLEIKGMP